MRFSWMILLVLNLTGCATAVVYNPMQVASQQEILLNEKGLKTVQDGMTLNQVHEIMGDQLLVGYQFKTADYKPLTIPNPYRTEEIQDKGYRIEYYIQAIRQPDGIVSDNELIPLVFQGGKLIGRGWSLANSIRPAKPAA
jgi:hypothetical protein